MIGVALEIAGRCARCGSIVPVNALVAELQCPLCQFTNQFGPETWDGLLEAALREGPELQPGDVRKVKVPVQQYAFEVAFDRAAPACSACKTELQLEDVEALSARGWAMCVGCGKRHMLRRAPGPLAPVLPPGALCAFENEDQLKGTAATVLTPSTIGHGASKVRRWYVCFMPQPVPCQWETMIDAVTDRLGNLYCAGGATFGESAVFALDPGRRLRWRVSLDLDDESRLTLAPNGQLLIGNPSRHALTVLQSADGAVLADLGGVATDGGAPLLDYEGGQALSCDADGTILVLTQDEIRRHTPDGRRVDPWPQASRRLPEAPALAALGPYPLQVRTDTVRATSGWDGFTYLWDGTTLVKGSRWGQIVWRTTLPFPIRPRPYADGSGWVWVLGDGGLARVAPDGRVQPSLTRRAAGGPLGDEDHLAVSPDGTLWLLGAEGRMRVLGPDGEVRFVSPRSQRADAAPASGE